MDDLGFFGGWEGEGRGDVGLCLGKGLFLFFNFLFLFFLSSFFIIKPTPNKNQLIKK